MEKTYELAAAFVVDEDELDELEDEESLLEDVDGVEDSFLAGAESLLSLLDSPALSLTVLDPLRLSVR